MESQHFVKLLKKSTLLITDGKLELFHHQKHILPNLAFTRFTWIMKQVRRMVSNASSGCLNIRAKFNAFAQVYAVDQPPINHQSRSCPMPQLLWAEQFSIGHVNRKTKTHFLHTGRTITICPLMTRAKIYHIAYVDRFSTQTHGRNNAVKQFTSRTYKGLSAISSSAPGASPA